MAIRRQVGSLFGFRLTPGIRGMEKVTANMSVAKSRIKDAMLKGLLQAQAEIFRQMDSIPPKIPVETENLRRSYYVTTSKGKVFRGKAPAFDDKNADAEKLSSDHEGILVEKLAHSVEKGKTVGPWIDFGFSAYYAMWVHENVGRDIIWTRKGSGAKFFESALKANRDRILKIIANNARIPK